MVEYILLIIFYNIFKEEVIMTKKKFLAALSTAAITTSLLATTAFAENWNTNGGTEKGEGNGEVRMPVIEVEVPVTLPFAVNPYKLNLSEDETNPVTDQIWSDNYTIVNHSEVPVAVKTESYAVAGTDVELESTVTIDGTTTKYTGTTPTKKNAFLGMQFAKTITMKDGEYEIKYDYATPWVPKNTDDKTALQKVGGLLLDKTVTESAKAEAIVVLNKETDANATGGKNAAAFKYIGLVNDSTTAAYTDEDFKVTTLYTLTVLANDDITAGTGGAADTVKGYTATTATDNAGTAWNAYKVTP